jgi:hypothetical protein
MQRCCVERWDNPLPEFQQLQCGKLVSYPPQQHHLSTWLERYLQKADRMTNPYYPKD